jgi:hypothetical protein
MEAFFRDKTNRWLAIGALGVAIVLIAYLVAAAKFLISAAYGARAQNLIKTSGIVTFNLAEWEAIKASRPD